VVARLNWLPIPMPTWTLISQISQRSLRLFQAVQWSNNQVCEFVGMAGTIAGHAPFAELLDETGRCPEYRWTDNWLTMNNFGKLGFGARGHRAPGTGHGAWSLSGRQ